MPPAVANDRLNLPSTPPLPVLVTGARVKITRNFLFGQDPERRSKPLVDLGVGVAVEMDQASMQPVARLKFKNLVSIKVRAGGQGWFLLMISSDTHAK